MNIQPGNTAPALLPPETYWKEENVGIFFSSLFLEHEPNKNITSILSPVGFGGLCENLEEI